MIDEDIVQKPAAGINEAAEYKIQAEFTDFKF